MPKVFKYEMIHSYRSYAMVFGIFLIGCLILPWMQGTSAAIGESVLIILTFGIAMAILAGIFINYNRSMFKRPGYLTLTLPINTHELLWGKILATLLWVLIGCFVLIAGYAIRSAVISSQYGDFYLPPLSDIWNGIGQFVRRVGWLNILKYLGQALIGAISMIISCYCLITCVQTKLTRRHKMLWAFILLLTYLFVLSLIQQAIGMQSFNVYNTISDNISDFTTLLDVIKGTLFYLLTVYILNHQLELE